MKETSTRIDLAVMIVNGTALYAGLLVRIVNGSRVYFVRFNLLLRGCVQFWRHILSSDWFYPTRLKPTAQKQA